MVKPATELTLPLQPEMEICMNPWNGICENTDIVLYIYYKGVKTPICRECWNNLASTNREWRYD